MSDRDADLGQVERIAQNLRDLADQFDSLAGTTLAQPLCVTMLVQPSGGMTGPFDEPSVIDAVGMAVLGTPGAPKQMSSGSWHHDAKGHVGEISFSVFGRRPDPNETPEEQEIRRLRAELDAANAKLAAAAFEVTS